MNKIRSFFFISLAILGILIAPHYGESWDEAQFYQYAGHALESYPSWFTQGEVIVTGNTYDNYGPAFVIFTSTIARWVHALLPNALISDLRHIIYFLTFLAGVWAFHDIVVRWMSPLAAFAATLLFLTQPLFWGHAFISPKDIPFMSLFLLSLALGLKMADAPGSISFDSLSSSGSRTLGILTAVWLALLLGLFTFTAAYHTLIANLVLAAKAGDMNIITWIAADLGRTGPEIYIQRYFVLFLHARAVFIVLFSILIVYLYYLRIPSVLQSIYPILLPGIALGLTTSIRILGPMAGLLVAFYAWDRQGRRALPTLMLYATIAIITMYVTWPYLWPDPPGRFLESAKVMSQYPWKGQVLFDGGYYASNHLPYTYVPVLLLIQFTESVWPLFAIGLLALRKNRYLLILTLCWFILPLLAVIFTHAPLYDNTRQIFFMLPPVFLAAGLGIDLLLHRINRPIFQKILVGLVILPGLIAGIRLHPYEYVYYNSLVADPTGKFELDYWATSYRAGTNWLNENVPANQAVLVIGPAQIAENYARPDLKIVSETDAGNQDPDLVMIVARQNLETDLYPKAVLVHKISHAGLIFSVIKEIQR